MLNEYMYQRRRFKSHTHLHHLIKRALISVGQSHGVHHRFQVSQECCLLFHMLLKPPLSFSDGVWVTVATVLTEGKATEHGIQCSYVVHVFVRVCVGGGRYV